MHNNLVKFFSKTEFDPAKIARASKAAKGLCRWVRAMHNYHLVNIVMKGCRINLKIFFDIIASETAERGVEESERDL